MIITGNQLAAAAKALAINHKSVYGLGCFGWPMTKENQERAIAAYPYNARSDRRKVLLTADVNTFAFDCVGMIKALLWGWSGNRAKSYGGAIYASNDVPDINADRMIEVCRDVSKDFSEISVGEVLWRKGHIGVYIGDGLAVECTPKWKDGVQITEVHNLTKQSNYNGRVWTSHGKLPWLTYAKLYPMYHPLLSLGSESHFVKAVQQLLIGWHCDCGIHGADGKFGADTESAVRTFQAGTGLTADGIVGPKTLAALLGVDIL